MISIIGRWIDLSGAGSVARAARDKLYSTHIIFVHVPKSGGTSLSHELRLKYPFSYFRLDEHASRAPADSTGADDWMALKRALIGYHAELGYHFIQGHFCVSEDFMSSYSPPYRFITILRNPIDRLLSIYHFEEELHRLSLQDFIASDRGRIEAQVLGRFFGELDWSLNADLDAGVSRAIANLERFDVVGILEHPERFKAAMHSELGLRLHLPKRNVGRHKRKDPISEETRRRIEAMCRHDLVIYNHFRERTTVASSVPTW